MTRSALPLIFGLIATLYATLAVIIPPFDDEIYYWCWAQNLQLSYFDHPPMTAVMIWASTSLFGDSVFAIRLPGMLTMLTVLAVLYRLCAPKPLIFLALLTPMFTLGAAVVTPDTPLLLFWTLYVAWLVKIHTALDTNGPRQWNSHLGLWILGGLILGCGMLGKYTMALAVPAGFVSFLSGKQFAVRDWLFGYILHGIVSAIVFSPVLIFNYLHDFAPLLFQWQHAMGPASRSGLSPFAEFVGAQLAFVGPLPLVLLPWAWLHYRQLCQTPTLRVCTVMFAVPMTFFLYKAFRGPLEGNWAMACYLSLWPVAAAWFTAFVRSRARKVLALSLFVLPSACLIVGIVHTLMPLSVVPPAKDRLHRQTVRLELARQAVKLAQEVNPDVPIYAATYQWTALLQYAGGNARQLDGATRPSNFTLDPQTIRDGGPELFVFNEGPLPMEFVEGYAWPEIVANFPVVVRGTQIGYIQLYRYVESPECANIPLTPATTD